ncbi:dystrophin [Daphnia sinensis]|uniref:Dystrophin n=1 Tax=Daphnia sinensis TaxID=1820382 RepID=A0AAD5KPW2_9CRUS|nr:dystrophin [Daphnia sinensis]
MDKGPKPPGCQLYDQHLFEIQYEREDVQKKTFGKWINSQLIKINFSLVTDLFYDLRDGTRLLALLSVLTGRTYKPEKGHMRVHHLNNVSSAFRLLDKHNVKLVNISSNDIVDGNPKLTLGLVWSIILHWQVQDVLKGSMAELQQSSLEKTLLSWCQEATKDYAEIAITNFTTSWSDGLAFIALIHRFRPDLFDYEIVSRKPANARLEYAFRMANKHLEIARLLDPEDVNTSNPDKKSIMMYVMCLYQALPHAKVPLVPSNGSSSADATTGSSGASATSSKSNEPVDFSAYQTLMEEVLVWLLAAEDHLDSATTILGDLQSVKEQFHKHEEFLLELTSQQGSVGAVLHEGARLVKEGELSNEEADEIHIQMRLLNSRWDQLRTKSMDRQARIHETLTKLQQEQLERLRQWLTATEDRISQLAAVPQPETLTAADQMLQDHQSLQRDLEAQQEHVNALSNMVVIVDESVSDNCAQMEDQLSALGERWSHVCRWAEQRASALQQLSNHWEQLTADLTRLKCWLASHEHSLRLIETNPSTDRSQMIDVARQLQLLERDMEPHVQRLSQLQENILRLPTLIHAVTVKENSKKSQPVGNFKCVDRLLSDVENFEDRMEALNEIMEAQRQRLAKSGLDLTMVVLPPDITTSLTAFGSNDAINNTVRSDEEATSIKKRKLDTDRHLSFEAAIHAAKQHLEKMEILLEEDSNPDDLTKRHVENKTLLDEALKSGHILLDELQNEASESFAVEDTMSSITERWLLVEELLTQKGANQQDVERLLRAKHCEKELDNTLSTVNKLSNVEERNEETLSKFQAMLQMVTDQINNLTSPGSESCEKLETAVESLKCKICNLESRISEFEKDVVLYRQLKDESQSLDKWMAEVNNFLTAEDVAWGDVEVLEAQLEQSNALQDDVKTLEPSVANIKHVITLLAPKVDEDLLAEMNEINERLATTWITVIAGALQKNGVLTTALSLTRQTVDGIESTNTWLNELELEIPPPAVINSTSELSQTLRKLNALKNRVDLKTNEYKSFIEAGNAVVAHPHVSEELKDNFRLLSQRWNAVSGGVVERQRALKAASHHYGEFKVLTAQECDWQDKLEKKLMRSTTLAADAEEISEELDDLENYMKNRPKARLLRIESMGNELVSLNIMSESVGSEVKSLADRWAVLEEKAKEKAEWLEKRVRGAQQCEQRLVQLHSAINSIDAELCSSLEQDLYGDELPELSQRLSHDIAQQEALLSEIRHEEEDYQAEGRKEAANRLHEQLSFIEATLQDVRNKFRKFQNPSELEPRLERMLRVLRDLEQSMCYIELASDDCEAIEGQLNNCIRFYASLSDIKTEVEAVLREGRQQVEEELVEDKLTVSAELDAMKALYNRLGEQVAIARETLEKALQLSYQLNLDINAMTDWLNHLVSEIHKTEDTFADDPNTAEEIPFYEKCLDEMLSNQSKMDSIRDNYGLFCGLCDPTLLETLRERVEDITQEWQRIEERLKNKISNLKGEHNDDHDDVEDDGEPPHLPQQNRNGGDVPVRMYRSVVLTSVRQFTDPGSPTMQKASLELPASPTLAEDMDPKDLTIDVEMEESDSAKDEEMDGPGHSTFVDTLGYFNAAFEDFEEQEKEAYMQDCVSSSRSGLEVIRGNVVDFNEEDEEMIESSPSLTSDSSSESSDSNSVKDLPVDIETMVPEKLKILQVDDSYVVEVKAGNLPSPEVPSMEVLNSRPITPDDFLTPEEEAWTYPQITVDADQQIVSTVTNHEEVTVQNQVSFEQLVIERFNSQRLTVTSQDRCHSPVTTSTPPPTPALCETNAFDETFANDSPKVDGLERLEVRVGEHDKHEVLPPLEALQVIEVDDKAPDDGQPPLDEAEGRVAREVEEQVATDYDQEIQILKAPCTEVVFHSLSGKSSPSVDVVKPGVIENVPIIEVPVVEDVLVIDAAVADETLVAGKAPIIENILVVEEHQGSCPIEKEAEKGMSEHPDDGKQQIIEDFVEIDVAEVENVQTRVVEDTVEHMVVDVSKEVSSDDKQFQVLPDSNEMEHVKDEDVMIVEENQLCISTQEVIADDDLSQSSASSSDMNDFEGENVPVYKDCQSPQYSPSAEKKIIETSVLVTEDDKTAFVEELADSPALSRSTSSSCSSSDAGEEQIPVVKDEQPHVLPSIEVTVHQFEDATADDKQLQQFEETIEIDEVREQEVKVLTDEQPRIARSHTGSSEISSLSRESDDIQQETSNVENSRISKEAVDICREAIESDSAVGTAVLIDDEKEAIVLNRPLDQNLPHEAELVSVKAGSVQLTANEARAEDANDPTQRALSVTNIRPSRKVSRDEGTQTDFCGYTGRLHVSTPVQPAESTSIIQTQTIPLQVEEMATSAADAQEDPSTTLQEIDADLNRLVASMESAEQVCPDGDVFAAVANVSESKAIEDVDSFYGSDKEVDSEVVFSHTDSSSSSSSSSESDVEPETIQKLEIEASSPKDVQESQLDREIAEFNAEVKLMSQRIDEVSAKFSPSSPIDLESAEMELSLLDPDVATLISRGDSLVLQVQKVDLERALRINTTTGELRAARTSLKASSEVRRQRQVEQELTLKDCQKKTEQLQLWLANIAQTLDHVTRINDQSQIESLEEELNRRQSDIRQLTEAAGKLKEQQVLEYQALISSLTIRWQDLQRQFVDFQTKETSALAADLSDDMGGPDFVTRVNKLREAIASVSRQMHSPPLNLKHYEQLSGQEDAIKIVKSALYTLKGDVDTYNREKNDAVEAADALQQAEEEWTLLNRTFAEKQVRVHQSQTTWRNLHADMKDFDDWLTGAEASLVNLQSESHNRSERKEKLKELESQVTARHKVMSNITSTCREVAGECSTADAVLLREKQDTLGKRWRSLLSGLAAVRQRLTSLDGSPLPVAKLTPLVMSPARKDETNGSEPDLTVHAAKETPPTTPSTIVASLDKSILQIRDWLTVLETMLKQQVAIVGDSDDVLQLLEKQKNVLRELEQKKPQLDELVQTAESIKDGGPPTGGKQLPAQVSKLREHWEETATAVTSRRNQLEELLTDSHQFERRKQDVDQWLGRMENRLSKLAPVAGTADLIDTQHREQKVLHNEIQQYKSQVEQLTQLSEKLVANYPHDDTSRAVRTNENLTQRYSVLHTGVNARGRALNAAMSSLHSFDRSLDKFMAWLSDTESALESLELELDSYGPGVKTSRERVLIQLKVGIPIHVVWAVLIQSDV